MGFFEPDPFVELPRQRCVEIVARLATTEMATTIDNGRTGYVDTNVDRLVEHMEYLLRMLRGTQLALDRLGKSLEDT